MISYCFDLIAYGFLFIVSYLFLLSSKKYNKTFNVYFIIAVMVLCLFATFRSYDIGTDTINYLNFYNLADGKTFSDLMGTKTFSEIEIGFDFLIWLSANVFHSYRVLLFISAFLTVTPIYVVIRKQENRISIFLASITFLLFLWGMTLNVIRQGIASAFFLVAISCWDDKEKFKAIFMMIFAILFHYGAVFGLVMIVIPYLLTKIKNTRNQNVFFLVSLIFLCVLASTWDVLLMKILGNSSGVLSSYTRYVEKFQGGYTYMSNVDIGHYIDLGIRIILVFLPILFLRGYTNNIFSRNRCGRKEYYNDNNELVQQERRLIYLSVEALFIDAFVLLFIGTMYGYRIVMCADFMMILTYANIAKIKEYQKGASFGKVNLEVLIITIFMITSFFIRYIWLHMHGISGLLSNMF